MNIEIIDAELAESEALAKAIERMNYINPTESATIFVNPRVPADAPPYKNPGWLEYTLVAKYKGGSRLTVGMIQRTPDSEFEFHS